MARDVKLVQRGVNVQGNDMAVPAGTPLRAVNVDYQRDGVAQTRTGFGEFYDGLPWYPIDNTYQFLSPSVTVPINRNISELFSRDRPMMVKDGMIFQYEEQVAGQQSNRWYSVPVNLPHRYTLFGSLFDSSNRNEGYSAGIGRALVWNQAIVDDLAAAGQYVGSAFRWQNETVSQRIFGTVGNSSSQQQIGTSSLFGRFYQIADVASANGSHVVSDFNSVRTANANGTIVAGSTTATGTANGTGTAATFDGASWMAGVAAGGSSYVLVADNTNQIRKVVISSGVVTTFAGSVTAGDTDGVGTAARFRGISGLAYDGSQFLYVSESGGSRIRRCDVTTGSVTIFAGPLTPTPGYVDATGTAARFDSPVGIEYVNGDLYVGDSGNDRVRKITTGAVVTTYAGSTLAGTDGIVGGPALSSCLPGVVVRGKYAFEFASTEFYLTLECTTANSDTIDLGLIAVSSDEDARSVFHYARCPNDYPTQSTGPTKLGTTGPNAYGIANTRGIDVGSGALFTTSEQPRVVDAWTRFTAENPQPRLRPLGINAPEAPSVTTVAGTTFASSSAWAYRAVCGMSLPDGRIALGPPSERVVCIGSTTATCAGSVTTYPPPGLVYDGMPFVQIYRTKTFANTLDPGDQMFLCYETPMIYGVGVSFVDQLPDALLGAELYTNATEDGLGAASLAAPNFATDSAWFGSRVVLSNFVPKATVRAKIIGASALGPNFTIDVQSDTLFLAGSTGISYGSVRFTGIAGATDPVARQFQIASGGTPAENAVQTARNIVECINRSPDAYMFSAQYDESDPGSFIVINMFPGLSGSPLGVVLRSSGSIETVPTNVQSDVYLVTTNDNGGLIALGENFSSREANRVAYSDQGAFDSFPVTNDFQVGPATESIVRIMPIAETLLAVKDDSVWRTDDTFAPQIYDVALSCFLPNSFARINNQWIGLFTRGFVSLNSSQAVAIGRPIDRDVTAQYQSYLSGFSSDFASAAAIDVNGNYLCTFNNKTYCYNSIAQAWSEWQINQFVRQYPNLESTSTVDQHSGILSVGAFRDRFISSINSVRGVFRQRDFRGDANEWWRNYSDVSYDLEGVLSADKQTIAVAAYNTILNNPGTLPPFLWRAPVGEIENDATEQAVFLWGLDVEQSAVSVPTQGSVTVTTIASATSPMTIHLAYPLAEFASGSVTVTAAPPVIMRIQYAPAVLPGSNAQFGDVLLTVERAQSGWLVGRFFNRHDYGNSDVFTDGPYLDTYGVSRAVDMTTLSPSTYISRFFTYHDAHRFAVPRERATDQVLGVEFWTGAAWSPFAIKAVSIEKRPDENSKVVR